MRLMRLESILQRAKEAAKCEASSSSSSAHDEVPWPELKRRAIIKGLDFLLSMGETLFRNETLSSKHGADVLLPFYVPTSKAAASPEERHALKVALRLAAEWRSRAAKVVKLHLTKLYVEGQTRLLVLLGPVSFCSH